MKKQETRGRKSKFKTLDSLIMRHRVPKDKRFIERFKECVAKLDEEFKREIENNEGAGR